MQSFLPHFSETWSIGYILTKVEFTYQTKRKYEIQYAAQNRVYNLLREIRGLRKVI
jgi:hypothetical protein